MQDEKDQEKREGDIADFLTAPRKKRKNYVIMATGKSFDPPLAKAMEGFITKSYPSLAVSQPPTPQDLQRQFGRNISLLILNDEFSPIDELMSMVKILKEKRRRESIPVLFLTRKVEKLVEIYQNTLLPYHECDEYVYYPGISRQRIFSRIKNGIDSQNKRKSRRYKVNFHASFFHLFQDQTIPGRVLDLSLHGAVVKAEASCLFREGDQIRMNIPVADYLGLSNGDFLKLSAKVRRVYISGNIAAVSFEYLSETQLHYLSSFLTGLVVRELQRQSGGIKTSISQS